MRNSFLFDRSRDGNSQCALVGAQREAVARNRDTTEIFILFVEEMEVTSTFAVF